MTDLVLIERDGPVALLTMNRPEALNALSRALSQALSDAFRTINEDPDVRAIVLTGAGRAFCAGLDLKEAAEHGVTNLDDAAEIDVAAAMQACPWPIIAAVNGFALTGGLEIVLLSDVIYAATGAKFADTHARARVLPGWGLSQRLSRTIGLTRAKEFSLSGNYIDAETAERWGLVNRVFPSERLLPAARKLAHDMATLDATILRKYKRLIDEGYALSFADALALERKANRDHLAELTAGDLAGVRGEMQARGRQQR